MQGSSHRIQTAPTPFGTICVSHTCDSGQVDCWQFVPWTTEQTELP
ncbi:hypothetical protein D187_005336 [Cystobacter fuscus DSM 2262]|uniref:Uncharacterized protein n=1 Tax=Cystobacter fuscus (strain ATCC 25194 / DSM 2262 / NBRC 100088 / M29) TaxID=1242864 RepID=S9PP09_CYSF2|nr:hypothetical protein D187_005336 [Cystobacter fuscus DSM 2262]